MTPSLGRVIRRPTAESYLSAWPQHATKFLQNPRRFGKHPDRKTAGDVIECSVVKLHLLGIHLADFSVSDLSASDILGGLPDHSGGKIYANNAPACANFRGRREQHSATTRRNVENIRAEWHLRDINKPLSKARKNWRTNSIVDGSRFAKNPPALFAFAIAFVGHGELLIRR